MEGALDALGKVSWLGGWRRLLPRRSLFLILVEHVGEVSGKHLESIANTREDLEKSNVSKPGAYILALRALALRALSDSAHALNWLEAYWRPTYFGSAHALAHQTTLVRGHCTHRIATLTSQLTRPEPGEL